MSEILIPIVVPMQIAESVQSFPLGVSSDIESVSLGLGVSVNTVAGEHYDGETHFTPTREAQTVHTAGTIVDEDIIVEPIPQNYGLITWNGSSLTVS